MGVVVDLFAHRLVGVRRVRLRILVSPLFASQMTRGNQREIDRERARKRAAEHGKKGNTDGLTPAQRRERDAAIMRQKAEAAQKKQEEAAGQTAADAAKG